MRDLIIEKAKEGGYGFNTDYVLKDWKVKNANRENYKDCIREAIINYAEWQLNIAKNYDYDEEVIKGLCRNVEKQLTAYENFRNDWNIALLLDGGIENDKNI